jgi:DNA polymerase III alpha subunit
VFLLLEDEHGTVNLIVSPDVYERDRLAVRVEPLVVAEGTLERFASSGGAINIVVRRLVALDRPDDPLSAVERCVDHIARRTGEVIDLSRIPFDDPATYTMIQEADTTGVFQIESRAQMASLRRTRPETLEELTIQVAIVRPGPIQGGAVNPYIARRQKLREDPDFEVPYDHPSLEPVLRETLGAIIFQDQVIEVAMAFAGFSPGEAEGLRRAMSRKRSEAAIMAHRERFVRGAMECHPGRRRGARRAGVGDGRRLLGLRVPEGPRRRVRPARLPVDLAARPPPARVRLRPARRAADGLLSTGLADPRGPAPRPRGPPARRQPQRPPLHAGV